MRFVSFEKDLVRKHVKDLIIWNIVKVGVLHHIQHPGSYRTSPDFCHLWEADPHRDDNLYLDTTLADQWATEDLFFEIIQEYE